VQHASGTTQKVVGWWLHTHTCCIAGDTLGNIALLDIHGKEIWERHVKSMLGQVRLFCT
jgi:hypothetical protein